MIPNWPEVKEENARKALEGLVGHNIGGLFINGPARNVSLEFVHQTMQSLGMVPTRDKIYLVSNGRVTNP